MCVNNSQQEGYKTVLQQAVAVFHEAPWCRQPGAGTWPQETTGNFHAKHQQEDVAHLYLRSTLEENGSPPGRLRSNAKQGSLPQSRCFAAAPLNSEPSPQDAPHSHRPPQHKEPGMATSSPSSPGRGGPPRLQVLPLGQPRSWERSRQWGFGEDEPQPLQTSAITWEPSAEPFHSA